MNQEEIDELLLKWLQGKAEDSEYETVCNWVDSSSANLEYFRSLRDTWMVAGIGSNNSEYDIQNAWRKIERNTGGMRISLSEIFSGWKRTAAIFIIAFISGAFFYHFFNSLNEINNFSDYLVKAPLGSKTYIILPDSSEIWLNAGSTIQYSSGYGNSSRVVQLTGEAFFEVAENNNQPFIVHASDVKVKAIGTSFNIKAYPEESSIETTLVSGILMVEGRDINGDLKEILLRPNQKASFIRGESGIFVSEITEEPEEAEEKLLGDKFSHFFEKVIVNDYDDVKVVTSWKDGRFIFQGEKMSDLAVRLERIYDITISFEDEELKSYHLTGSLEQETLEQLLTAIRLTIPMDYSILKNNVKLSLNTSLRDKYKNFSD